MTQPRYSKNSLYRISGSADLSRRSFSEGGFTLVEMAVVMVILAMAAAGGLAIVTRSTDADNMRTTRERMEKILDTVELYVLRYGHLPCPASPTFATTSTAYGQSLSVATATPGTPVCSTAAAHNLQFTDTGNATDSATHVFMGAVPVGALGLHPDYMLDGWGRQFAFVVDEDLTQDSDSDSNSPYFQVGGTAQNPSIAVLDAGNINFATHSASATESAAGYTVCTLSPPLVVSPPGVTGTCMRDIAVLLISYGRNGFGAYPYKGTAKLNDSRSGATTTRTMENDNTHYDPGSFDSVFRMLPWREVAAATAADDTTAHKLEQSFDDVLMWRTKWDLDNATNN